jgi:hypothetical protein
MRSHVTYEDDSATISARVCTPDVGLMRLERVVIRCVKDENKCCI